MSIKTKLYLSSGVTAFLVFSLIVNVIFTSYKISAESRRTGLIKSVASVAEELKLGTYRYLLGHDEQIKQQWFADYQYIFELLAPIKKMEKDKKYIAEIATIQKKYANLDQIFSDISAKKSADGSPLSPKVENLLVKLQGLVSDTSLLARVSGFQMDKTQMFSDSVVLIVGIILSYTATITALFIVRNITSSLNRLRKGVEIVGKGELSYSIDTEERDEIGELARAFNEMRAKLRQSYESIEDEVKTKTKELASKVRQLQKAKQATTKLLNEVEIGKEIAEEQKARAETMLQSIGDGILVADQHEKIVVMNPAAEKLTGWKAIDAVGRGIDEVFNLIDEKSKTSQTSHIKEILDKGKAVGSSRNLILVKKNGTEISVADSGAPIKDSKKRIVGAILVFRDISKEREIDRMKTEFVSVASHQLRTPLTAVKWALEIILHGDAGKLSQEQEEFLRQAFDSNERMIALVNGLLNVSRIESGNFSIEAKKIDAIALMNQIIAEFTPVAKAGNKTIHFLQTKTKLADAGIITDPKLLQQVVENIISNAIKYTPAKGVVICSISKKGNELIFSIRDTGIGIPKQDQHKIFQKFFRANNAVERETEGNGLGLYIAKSTIESLGGSLWFESPAKITKGLAEDITGTADIGPGTEFYIRLPMSGLKNKKGTKSLESLYTPAKNSAF